MLDPPSLHVIVFPPCWVNPTWPNPPPPPPPLCPICHLPPWFCRPRGFRRHRGAFVSEQRRMRRHLSEWSQAVSGQKRVPESQQGVRSAAGAPRGGHGGAAALLLGGGAWRRRAAEKQGRRAPVRQFCLAFSKEKTGRDQRESSLRDGLNRIH